MAAGDRVTSSGAGRTAARPQPRPRAQVASSTPSVARNSARASGATNCQAAIRSTAGSPTASVPKSITAARRPSRTSRLPGAGSPWTQTGGPSHGGAASAASHAAEIGAVSTTPSSAAIMAAMRDATTGESRGSSSAQPRKPLLHCGRRAAVGVDPLQCGEERGEVERDPPRVGEGGGRRRLAVEPAQDRPGDTGSPRRARPARPARGPPAGAAARAAAATSARARPARPSARSAGAAPTARRRAGRCRCPTRPSPPASPAGRPTPGTGPRRAAGRGPRRSGPRPSPGRSYLAGAAR